MPDPLPDARRLAALLDGRLGGAEREQLLSEIAASDDALDVYADAAAALDELKREGLVPDPTPLPAPRPVPRPVPVPTPAPRPAPPWVRRPWVRRPVPATPVEPWDATPPQPRYQRATPRRPVPRWAALAAGIGVVALAPALWWRARSDDGGGAADGASSVALLAPESRAAGLPAGWNGSPWRVTRGAGDPLTPEARAVRVGARLTDLELAADARDTAAVRATAAEVAALLDEVPGAGAAAATYRALGTSAAPGAAALGDARRDAVLVAGESDASLGMWLEAARLAAARRDRAFFRSAESRATLGRLRSAGAGAGREDVSEAAGRVAAAATREPPAWDALGEALTAVLRALGG